MDFFSRYIPSWSKTRDSAGSGPDATTSIPEPPSTNPQSSERPPPALEPASSGSNPRTVPPPTISLDEDAEIATSESPESSVSQQTPNQIQRKPATTDRNDKTSAQQASNANPPQTNAAQATSLAPTPKPSSLMPPPAAPVPRLRPTPQPDRSPSGLQPPRIGNSPRTPLSSAGAARLNPTLGSSSLSTSTLAPQSLAGGKKSEFSRRVILGPGYSPLDWAALASDPKNKLRGENVPSEFIRVTPSMLKAQNGRKGKDAWTSYQGKVYNISPYLPYHPGGKGELLRGAGKDSAKLFQEVHPWVNWDGILNECLVGILVSEDAPTDNTLDAMD